MKKSILYFKAIIFSFIFLFQLWPTGKINAQSPGYIWAKPAGGTGFEWIQGSCTDINGNVFITGIFSSPTITFGNFILNNTGNGDIFIVKYDAGGNALWANAISVAINSWTYNCATDPNGNLFVTGFFSSPSITFGNIVLTNNSIAPYGDMFIVKYDPNGNVLWAKSAGGAYDEDGLGCTTDLNGNVFITGNFGSHTIAFGTSTLTNTGNSINTYDVFIVKYDGNGNLKWAKSVGGTETEAIQSCSADANGNVLITGGFSSANLTIGTTVLTNLYQGIPPYVEDMFIAKYDANGNELWAKSAGETGYDLGSDCATDASGNTIVTGSFRSPAITFGNTVLTNPDTSGNTSDVFIVKYDFNGNVMWAKSAGGSQMDEGQTCATFINGDFITTGIFTSSNITFGNIVLINSDTTGNIASTNDIFIVKYDSNGNVLWAKSAGGMNNEYSCVGFVDLNGNIFIVGPFNSPVITFGTTVLTNTVNTGTSSDLYLAKLGEATGIETEGNWSADVLSIFPNPFTNKLNITTNNNQLSQVTIYDITSRKLLQQSFTNSITLNTEQLVKGIYIYEVRNKDAVIKKGKVVKE